MKHICINKILNFQFKTRLIQVTKIQVTQSQFDIILAIKSSSYGVYLSVRGSSLLHLYDSSNITHKLLFDTNDNKIKPINPDKVRDIIVIDRNSKK